MWVRNLYFSSVDLGFSFEFLISNGWSNDWSDEQNSGIKMTTTQRPQSNLQRKSFCEKSLKTRSNSFSWPVCVLSRSQEIPGTYLRDGDAVVVLWKLRTLIDVNDDSCPLMESLQWKSNTLCGYTLLWTYFIINPWNSRYCHFNLLVEKFFFFFICLLTLEPAHL